MHACTVIFQYSHVVTFSDFRMICYIDRLILHVKVCTLVGDFEDC